MRGGEKGMRTREGEGLRFGSSQVPEGGEVPGATGDEGDSCTGRRFSLARRRDVPISEWREIRLG